MHRPINGFGLKGFGNLLLQQQAPHHIQDCPVFPLGDAILLGRVWGCQLLVNAIIIAEGCEFG
jgi:hypothetical protein